MTAIVIVSHRGVGESLCSQAQMILGCDMNVSVISIAEIADPESSLEEITRTLEALTDPSGALILTDLPGATPHNLALKAAEGRDLPIVSGLNLPMLLKVANREDKSAAELAELANLGGCQGIVQQ
jgi:mannose/fructose-specific phosphotransferase system component IIA